MRRYILAPEAALDLVEIWRYLKNKSSIEVAERVESAIRIGSFFWREPLALATGART